MSRIPKNAKRVFQGVIFDVYHWRQKMFDGSYQTFEMLKRPNTVEVIAVQGQKIIIAEQLQPRMKVSKITFFGGRQESGETALQTAKRELLEEAGLKAKTWRLLKVYSPYSKMDYQVYWFVARDCQQVAKQKLDAGEKIKLRPVDFKKLLRAVASPRFWNEMIADDVRKISQNKKKLAQFKKQILG